MEKLVNERISVEMFRSEVEKARQNNWGDVEKRIINLMEWAYSNVDYVEALEEDIFSNMVVNGEYIDIEKFSFQDYENIQSFPTPQDIFGSAEGDWSDWDY